MGGQIPLAPHLFSDGGQNFLTPLRENTGIYAEDYDIDYMIQFLSLNFYFFYPFIFQTLIFPGHYFNKENFKNK